MPDLVRRLETILGPEHVLSGERDRAAFSSDVFKRSARDVALIIVPGSVEELAAAVKIAAEAGFSTLPRGGGLSFSAGYVAIDDHSIAVDTRRLDRILEINTDDMYVTVECGCTWSMLYEELRKRGYRTPYFGPMSGRASTIGGGLSQGAIFLGSTQYGSSAESTLSVQVLLANGELLVTGSSACMRAGSPYMRHFGPDLTGIFLNDTGAMGIKVRASLRIVEWPKATGHRSFAFDALEPMLATLSTIGRKGLAAECWGFDPYLQGKRLEREGIVKDFATLAGVIRSGRSVLGGVKSALQIAAAGRRAFANVEFALHSTVDARSNAALEADLAELTSIAESAGGRAIAATFPQAVRGVPFSNVPDANVIGPQGERSLPVNVVVPHSRALEAVRDIVVALEPHEGAMQALGVNWGYTLFAVSTTMVVIDVIFFWKDAPHAGPQPYRSWTHAAELSAAGALVDALRETLTAMFFGKGYAYLQIGRAYPYPAGLQPGARSLLEGIKQLVDPERRMNPGSLQL